MNKTLKAIATLSILFFLGSCTENYYNTTNNTYNTYNTVTGDSLSTQESMDTALIGHWVADDTITNGKMNLTFSVDQKFACYESYPDQPNYPLFNALNYYTISNILHILQTDGTTNPDYWVGDYNISGNTMVTENFSRPEFNGSWIKQ